MKRELRLFDIFCLGVNGIVGSGIYLFPAKLALSLGPASIAAFALTGLALLPAALCFAWLASRYDATGGPYLYARDAFGPKMGFAIGWMAWVTAVLSYAAVANAVAVYLGHFSPSLGSPIAVKAIAGGVIIVLGIINYIGIRPAAWTTDFFTIAKLIPLVIFLAAGFASISPEAYSPFAPRGWSGLGPAMFLAFFAYQGFEAVPVPSGEARSPKRDVPIAVAGSLLAATVLYTWIQFVAVGVYPELAGSNKPLADAALAFLGPWAGLLAVGAAVSTLGYTTGAALVTPRYLYALAENQQIPAELRRQHPKFRTPYLAIIASGVVALALSLTLDFLKLVDLANVTVAFQYVVTCAAAWRLQRISESSFSGWRLPGGPTLPILGIAIVLWLGSQATGKEILTGAIVLAGGFILSAGFRLIKNPGTESKIKEPAPESPIS